MVMINKKIPEYNKGRNHYQSISKKLRKDNKIDTNFEVKFSSLTLEEIIALKLELSASMVRGKLFGLPIAANINTLVKDSLIKFALSATNSHKEAASLLGLSVAELKRFIKKYRVNEYFES